MYDDLPCDASGNNRFARNKIQKRDMNTTGATKTIKATKASASGEKNQCICIHITHLVTCNKVLCSCM